MYSLQLQCTYLFCVVFNEIQPTYDSDYDRHSPAKFTYKVSSSNHKILSVLVFQKCGLPFLCFQNRRRLLFRARDLKASARVLIP